MINMDDVIELRSLFEKFHPKSLPWFDFLPQEQKAAPVFQGYWRAVLAHWLETGQLKREETNDA